MCVGFVKRIINFDSKRDRDEDKRERNLSQTQFKVKVKLVGIWYKVGEYGIRLVDRN